MANISYLYLMINLFLNKIMPVRRRGQGIYIFRVGVWDRREKEMEDNCSLLPQGFGVSLYELLSGAFVRVPGLVRRTKTMEMGV